VNAPADRVGQRTTEHNRSSSPPDSRRLTGYNGVAKAKGWKISSPRNRAGKNRFWQITRDIRSLGELLAQQMLKIALLRRLKKMQEAWPGQPEQPSSEQPSSGSPAQRSPAQEQQPLSQVAHLAVGGKNSSNCCLNAPFLYMCPVGAIEMLRAFATASLFLHRLLASATCSCCVAARPAQSSPAQSSPAQSSPAQRSPAQRSPAQRSPAQSNPAQSSRPPLR
jgi:hypothetical protein